MKQILILGAGLVARPAARYLLEKGGCRWSWPTRRWRRPKPSSTGTPMARPFASGRRGDESLGRHVSAADIVVSLLPWTLHPALPPLPAHRQAPGHRLLCQGGDAGPGCPAREKGLIFLNEVGVDPGLDHMSAMQIIDTVRADGGRIDSFFSYCGGLPALESNNNPLGYKFSWSPEGAMLAATNDGRYMEHGKVIDVPGDRLFKHYWLEKYSRCRRLRSLRQPRCPALSENIRHRGCRRHVSRHLAQRRLLRNLGFHQAAGTAQPEDDVRFR
jgi:hypothetical protein